MQKVMFVSVHAQFAKTLGKLVKHQRPQRIDSFSIYSDQYQLVTL